MIFYGVIEGSHSCEFEDDFGYIFTTKKRAKKYIEKLTKTGYWRAFIIEVKLDDYLEMVKRFHSYDFYYSLHCLAKVLKDRGVKPNFEFWDFPTYEYKNYVSSGIRYGDIETKIITTDKQTGRRI